MSKPPVPSPATRPGNGARVTPTLSNTLNMDGAGLDRFLNARDAKPAGGKDESFRRRHVRWPYRVATLRVEFSHPGGSDTKLNLACRNLSAGGVGLLHRNYVHKGTRCTVWLLDVTGRQVATPGTVVRCTHLDGSVHEAGVQFDAPLDAKRFVKLDPFDDGFALEMVNPATLKGTVLYVEDSPLDQALVRHFLRETQVNLQVVTSMEEAVEKAMAQVDLILCDFDLGEHTGVELTGCLRAKGLSTPIIMLTADTSQVTRRLLSKVQADAFLAKPLKPATLYRAIAEFMILSDGGAMMTTLPSDHPSLGLLPTFVQQVRDYAKALEKAIEARAHNRCRSLCLQIAGAAPVMGFDRLAAIAKTAETAVAASMSVQESIGPLNMLKTACLQVSPRLPE
jgi:CheY-like chemotaxis protein